MLTAKQHELLLFIHERLAETGVSPSFEEMKEALDLKSKSGVHRLIGALEERQFLRRLPNRARALEVMRLPGGQAVAGASSSPVAGSPVTGSAPVADLAAARARKAEADRAQPHDAPSIAVPLVGKIAAGLPIEAIEDHEQLAVPQALLGPGEHYALQVSGDSMIEAGIFDGDFALIRKAEEARDGEIVVALIDNAEATLKYLHREKGMIRLDPANSLYDPQYYLPSRVKIQGKLAGLLRRY
ncbi:transcriptional repressor LexA [Sandaracinobacter neustonicus]|uniref:LexA repressor n=1 Tax=Sandaracinobacter neustonicus TaxID=1715348 RepID=A0A501XGT6_9SPHN|nr:transcriptional repressor LexA [Sandaracinobacter neustonicus]TPE59504.1 transcriptional repressor LexA [Sandaracinobacter neustonicus]